MEWNEGYRRTSLGLLALTLLVSAAAMADSPPDSASELPAIISDADCATLACRPASLHSEMIDGETKTGLAIPRSPYVAKDGTIILYPNEELQFDFPDAKGDVLGAPRFLHKRWLGYSPIGDNQLVIGISCRGGDCKIDAFGRFTSGLTFSVLQLTLDQNGRVSRSRGSLGTIPAPTAGNFPMFVDGAPAFFGPILISNFRPQQSAPANRSDVTGVPVQALTLPPLVSDVDCRRAQCRPKGHYGESFHGKAADLEIVPSPYVASEGTIIAYPGENLLIDFPDRQGDTLGSPRFVRLATEYQQSPPQPNQLLINPRNVHASGEFMSIGMYQSFSDNLAFNLEAVVPVDDKYPDGRLHVGICLSTKYGGMGELALPGFLGPVLVSGVRIAAKDEPCP